MKKLIAIVIAVVLLLTLGSGLVLAAPKDMDEGPPWTWSPGKGNARFTELQNKDYNWNWIGPDGRWGWIVHGFKMTGGNFKGSIEVKGMDANSWYLVTLYSNDPLTAYFLGQVGYYGRVPKYDSSVPEGWADIALFQTNAKGNAKIKLPYTSPAIDPAFGTLTAPVLPTGSYIDVTVAVKYVGTGPTPNWGLVISGGYYGHPYDYPGDPGKYAQDYNLYEMAFLNFTIWDKLLLEKKDPSTWDVISVNGELTFRSGPEFYYKFKGWGLQPTTSYSLIYYADPWPGNNPGALIASGTSDSGGDLTLAGSTELNMDLPHPSDANYLTGAKIWLVPSSDYNASAKSVTAWNPTNYLFEHNLITHDDTDVP